MSGVPAACRPCAQGWQAANATVIAAIRAAMTVFAFAE
jgi:hypothetical protein